MKRLTQSDIAELAQSVRFVDANEGTAAFEYISGRRNIEDLEQDQRLLGGAEFPDCTLVVFKDGSSFTSAVPLADETPEQMDERLRQNSAAMCEQKFEA